MKLSLAPYTELLIVKDHPGKEEARWEKKKAHCAKRSGREINSVCGSAKYTSCHI